MSEEVRETENMTMADLEKEIDASFQHVDQGDDFPVWDKLRQFKEDKTVLTVTVDGVVKSGVVANVDGVRGFIPASKLSLSYVENLEDFLKKEIQVRVIDADEETKHRVLSARDVLRDKERAERKARIQQIEIGTVMEGKVESLQSYGAFVDLGDGLSGLVHVSQISDKRIKHPSAVLNVGDPVTVKVIAIKDGKLSLSMKALLDTSSQEEEVVEHVELPKSEAIGTTLGDLFKNIKL